jgi:hypothetical protein
MYFYRLDAENAAAAGSQFTRFSEVKKLLVVK